MHTTVSMRDLQESVQDLQLLDLQIDKQFTWMRRNSASRIDRILVGKEVIEVFPNTQASCGERVFSYHFSIIMASDQLV